MNNKIRKLKYVTLDQFILRLVIFIDVFFANNRDLLSQIEYVICLIDASNTTNILHWSSVKCKKVTRSVLAAELYAMIYDFDVDLMLKSILTKMFDVLISLILVTNSKSLYDCLVRLDIIVEKSLIINVIILRQNYKWREIIKVKWISDDHNPSNSITMSEFKASLTLKKMIDINQIKLNLVKWVKRINQIDEKRKRD
jgi:hypothetical protein